MTDYNASVANSRREKFILIDGTGLVYRGFYGIPPFFTSPSGQRTNAVFGFATILLSILASQKPEYLAVAFDKKGPTFRHEEYADYKATRVKAPQELYDQIPLTKDLLSSFNIPLFEADGFEADDIIATIVEKISNENGPDILIATGDFDMFQVVSEKTAILYPTKGFKGSEIFTESSIRKKYGLQPLQIPDYKGLAGDSSDNIPGVKGIGPKGATDLLKKYKNLEGIYENIDEINGATKEKLVRDRAQAFQSRGLATLRKDVPIAFDLSACRVKNFDIKKVKEHCTQLGFRSLIKRIDDHFEVAPTQDALF